MVIVSPSLIFVTLPTLMTCSRKTGCGTTLVTTAPRSSVSVWKLSAPLLTASPAVLVNGDEPVPMTSMRYASLVSGEPNR